MQPHDQFINVDDDGLNPPLDSTPEEVEGAIGYRWDPVGQVWIPIFEEEE